MRILLGLAVCVRTMKGSNVVTPPLTVLIVVAAAFVPHQLFAAVTVVLLLLRLLPLPPAVFPARRLKAMLIGPAGLAFPVWMPPPLPVVVLLTIVTLLRETVLGQEPGQPVARVL